MRLAASPVLLAPIGWLLLASGLVAAEPLVRRGAAEVGAPVVPFVVDVDLRSLPRAPRWRPGDPVVSFSTHAVGVGASAQRSLGGAARRGIADRTVGEPPPEVPLDPGFGLPLVNIEGQGFGGVDPPDTMGAVGADHYLQMIKAPGGSLVRIHDKTGAVVVEPFFLDSLGSGNCADGFGDPVALYDHLADRWLLTEFTFVGQSLCVYVSQTSDPVAGGWFLYEYPGVDFPDYPKYAVWPDAYYVSTREATPAAYALDRERMLAGATARPAQRFEVPKLTGFTFQSLTPADLDGPAPPEGEPGYFVRHRDDELHEAVGDPERDFLELYLFAVDWSDPAQSTFTGPADVALAEFDSSLCAATPFKCFDQPGGGEDLAPQREVVMWRLQYRNFGAHQALTGNFVTNLGDDHGGIRWFELRHDGVSDWSVHQEGTHSLDTADRWMGSIAQDQFGNLALAYNVVDETTGLFPSLRYTGRLATDPLGALPQGEHEIVEGAGSNGESRYGDYAALSVDPVDDCTFWFTGEYNATELFSTRIAAFRFADCGPPGPGPILTATGSCGGSVTIDVANATPNVEIAMVGAAGDNGFVKGGGKCAGTAFEISEPFQLPPKFLKTDAQGAGSTVLELPADRCFVQALDFATCLTSNLVDTSP